MNKLLTSPNDMVRLSGFSLVEVIVTLAITALIIGVGSSLIINSTRIVNYVDEQIDAVTAARTALDPLGKIIREISNGDNGEYPIITAEDTNFIFYSDIDNDAYTEQIEYLVVDDELLQRITEPSGNPLVYNTATAVEKVIMRGVVNTSLTNNPVFRYYNSDYPTDTTTNPLATPADVTDITLVEIHLDINVNPAQLPETSSVQTFIQLRNLKSNL